MEEIEKLIDEVIAVALPDELSITSKDGGGKQPVSQLGDSIYEAWGQYVGPSYRINSSAPFGANPLNVMGILQAYIQDRDDYALMERHLKRINVMKVKGSAKDLLHYLYHLDTLARLIANNKTALYYAFSIASRSLRFEYMVTHWRLVACFFQRYENKNTPIKERRDALEFCISVVIHMVGHINKRKGTPFTDSARLFHIDSPNAISNKSEPVITPKHLQTAVDEDNHALRTYFGGISGVEARLSLLMALRYELYYEHSLNVLNVKQQQPQQASSFAALFGDMERLVKMAELHDLVGVTWAIASAYTGAVKALTGSNKYTVDKETDCFLVLKAYIWRWLTAYIRAYMDFDAFNSLGDIEMGKHALLRLEEARQSERGFRKEFLDNAETHQLYNEAWLSKEYDVIVKYIDRLYTQVYDVVTGQHFETTDGVRLIQLDVFVSEVPDGQLTEALFAIHGEYENNEPPLIEMLNRLNTAIREFSIINTEEGQQQQQEGKEEVSSMTQESTENDFLSLYEKGERDERVRWLTYLLKNATQDGELIIIPAARIRNDYADLCVNNNT